jgi:hypothetical protein
MEAAESHVGEWWVLVVSLVVFAALTPGSGLS